MKSLPAWLLFCLLTAGLLAGEPPTSGRSAVFRLEDRTEVVGTIESYKDGVFQVKTKYLGVVDVHESNLAVVVYDRDAVVARADGDRDRGDRERTSRKARRNQQMGLDQQVQAVFGYADVMRALTGDQEIVGDLQSLRQDSDIQAVLDDPAIMKAIENSDFVSLLNNPKIQALMENPKIKAITGRIEAKGVLGEGDE